MKKNKKTQVKSVKTDNASKNTKALKEENAAASVKTEKVQKSAKPKANDKNKSKAVDKPKEAKKAAEKTKTAKAQVPAKDAVTTDTRATDAPATDAAATVASEAKKTSAKKKDKTQKAKPEKPKLKPLALGKTIKNKIFASNPIFVKFIAAIPILGAAVTLKNGILISAVMLLTVIFLNIAMYPLCKIVPRRFRHITEFVVAGILIAPQLYAASIFIPNVTTLCAFYLPLTAVSAIPMIETKYYGTRHGFRRTVLLAFLDACGFAFAALIFSVIREVIGSGLLYERPMPYASSFKLPFLTIPAGAFILLGLFAALWRKMFGINLQENEEDRK